MKYYRVETYDPQLEVTVAGCISVIHMMLYDDLGIPMDSDIDEYISALNRETDKEIIFLNNMCFYVSDINIPEIYANDRDEYICLYKEGEYNRVYSYLLYYSNRIFESYGGRLMFICKEYDIPDEELKYEDDAQVVISRDYYDTLSPLKTSNLKTKKQIKLSKYDLERINMFVLKNSGHILTEV